MRPLTAPRAIGALATVGALGATAAGFATGAQATTTPVRASLPPLHPAHWLIAGSSAASGLFGVLPAATRTAARARSAADATAATIHRMIAAGDRIARLPYVYGGGHGSFAASGYDCSGSVSYVLHAAGLLSAPQASGDLESFGEPGPGRHVTVYANGGHAWMTVDGRRFDTIALQETGTRWSRTISSAAGYTVRHPRGL
jgi:cell wall-associated NlpC family hydrolase